MHISQKEFERLVKYAEGLGIRVIYKEDNDSEYEARFIFTDPPTIELVLGKKNTTKKLILAMLHELGHYHDWVNGGKREPSYVFAKEHSELNLTERKVVYESERKATILAIKTAEYLELKFPKMNRIKLESAYDRWMYRYFVKTGEFPSKQEQRKKQRELNRKYK